LSGIPSRNQADSGQAGMTRKKVGKLQDYCAYCHTDTRALDYRGMCRFSAASIKG